MNRAFIFHALIPLLTLLLSPPGRSATLPSGFQEETLGGEWDEAVGLTFDPNGRMYVWERGGRVWTVENGVKSAAPLLDLRHEVGGWRDYGMLGLALHPNFLQNGHLYVSYVVDHHHLAHFGTPNYNVNSNEYFTATIGRITRYTARVSDGFRSIDPASRKVLVGETPSTGFPITHQSHGMGQLVFGTDGTLLASGGEGASYDSTDLGNAPESYYLAALAEGILSAKENVGAYRAQLIDSLSGKIIRIDANTGDGLPGNPFYDATKPRAARSRVWSLGLRNPFRMTLRPGTGSHNPADANPGVLYIGDVGWFAWEELNVATGPGQNFGWPAFEGLTEQWSYYNESVPNQDAPNPLFGSGGCTQRYFNFRELIQQATLNASWFPNTCNGAVQIPSNIPRFLHRRPAMDWRNMARAGTYDGNGNAIAVPIGASGSPVSGTQFPGNTSAGGVWYTADAFPAEYKNTYFHADFGAEWIRSFVFDSNNNPISVREFASGIGNVGFVAVHPIQGDLYYISWPATLRRIYYAPGGNRPPKAIATANKSYGPGPLTVQFTGSASTDPDGQPLTYRWNFGDLTPNSTAANPAHTFNAPSGVPRRYDVTLTVTDNAGATNAMGLIISVNNTPPSVTITSPAEGTRYPLTGDTVYNLTAIISDLEHSNSQLACAWQTVLHHNEHRHPEPVDPLCSTTTRISPVGCGSEAYWYSVRLTVTDAAGLSTTNEVTLYPDCPAPRLEISRNGTAVRLSWPTSFGIFQLQASAALGSASAWSNVTNAVATSGGRNEVSLPRQPGQQFFRLRQL
jgi:glucose/arabinose dehydrogenase/PKD repeat protein